MILVVKISIYICIKCIVLIKKKNLKIIVLDIFLLVGEEKDCKNVLL